MAPERDQRNMRMSESEPTGKTPTPNSQEHPDLGIKRQEILKRIEDGDLDVAEGLKMLEDLQESEHEQVLDQLDSGEIDVEEAIRKIGPSGGSGVQSLREQSSPEIVHSESMPNWRSWWYILLGFGLAGVATGGWLGTIGGWWWVCAAPSLFIGLIFFIFALASFSSPWLYIRIDTGQDSWPRRITLGLPVPFRFISWMLKHWGARFSGLDKTAIDELLLSLEGNLSSANPLVIDVHEDGESGERIQVYLG
jgi:hypothetical protein